MRFEPGAPADHRGVAAGRLRCCVSLLAALATTPAAAADPGAPREQVFALVVANNRSVERGLPSLRFADDDGAKYFEYFSSVGEQAVLLSVLDAETQARFPALRGRTLPPTRRELQASLARIFRAVREARARGKRAVFYFIYSGHGGVDAQGTGYVHLLDGVLTRGELFRQVIAPSPATMNHVIVDACNAYFLLHARGGWRDDEATGGGDLLRRFLKNESLERHPNTGVVLATSSGAETHEWSRFQGGIFSHEVRSALTGAADVDGDGAVSYSELAAYVAAANSRVTNQSAHLAIFTRPPALDVSEPLLRLDPGPRHRLVVARALGGPFHVEDGRGIRYADFHKSREQDLSIVLVPGARTYYLRGERGEATVELRDPPASIRVERLAPLSFAARGSFEEALRRGLYAVPFGPSFHAGYLAAWKRSLTEELGPAPSVAARDERHPAWRLELGYLLSTPALDRSGLAHGVALSFDRRIVSALRVGVAAQYATASHEGILRQHRVAALASLAARFPLGRWLALGGDLALGYLALLETQDAGDARGDSAAFTLALGAGPSFRVAPHLHVGASGGLIVDLFRADGARHSHLAPVLRVGVGTTF